MAKNEQELITLGPDHRTMIWGPINTPLTHLIQTMAQGITVREVRTTETDDYVIVSIWTATHFISHKLDRSELATVPRSWTIWTYLIEQLLGRLEAQIHAHV